MLQEEDDGIEREENVLELVSSAALFEETAESPTLASFLNELSLVSDLDGYEDGADAVVLMTVHSAKGLEFPTVFVPGFEEGLFPSAQSMTEGERGLEEERRLAYVAVTRAKKELFLLNTSSRMLYGRTEIRQMSRFGNEIPQDSCDRESVGDGQRNSSYGSSYGSSYNSARNDGYTARYSESRNSFLENVRATAAQKTNVEAFSEGDRVAHSIFGEGVIASATSMGGDMLYEIEFDSGAVKRLMGSFAKLKKI
jgi:DNA helicase-2/ATP-dependent DNA helicase PcrA